MTVLSKFFVLRRVKSQLTVGLVNSDVVQPDCQSMKPHIKKFRIASLNVGTLRGISSKVVETMFRRSMDLYYLQEIRWHSVSAHMIEGKDSHYKIFWVRNEKVRGGVGILLLEEWTLMGYQIASS